MVIVTNCDVIIYKINYYKLLTNSITKGTKIKLENIILNLLVKNIIHLPQYWRIIT